MVSNHISSSEGRAFISTRKEGCALDYQYVGGLRLDAIQRSAGALTPVFAGTNLVAATRSTPGLGTVSATARATYAGDSPLREAFLNRQMVHLQVHYGFCNDPTLFADSDQVLLLERAYITDYATTALAASQPSEVALVQETFTLSFEQALWRPGQMLTTATLQTAAVIALALADPINHSAIHRRVYALLEAPFTSGFTAHFALFFSDDGGVTWAAVTLDNASVLLPGPARHNRIACIGQRVVGINGFGIWTLDGHRLTNNLLVAPDFPDPRNPNHYEAVDIKRQGDKVFVLFADGAVTAVNADGSTEAYREGVVPNADCFCFTRDNHLLMSVYNSLGDTEVVEVVADTYRQVAANLDSGFRIAQMSCTPAGYVLLSTAYGNVYGKAADSDTFVPLLNSGNEDCINQFTFISPNVGYMTGRYVYRTLDGGQTWARLAATTFAPDDHWFVALAADADNLYVGGSNTAAGFYHECSGYTNAYGGVAGIIARSL